MISFKNDYGMGAHPSVLEALAKTNLEVHDGYGNDIYCRNAAALIRSICAQPEADVYFLSGGTQTNLTAIAAFLRAHEGVIAAESGHISDNETGSVEAGGHKIIPVPPADGKVTPEAVSAAAGYYCDERRVKPKLVYISNATETGTVYTKNELAALRETCNRHGLWLYLDGARLAQALASPVGDMTLADTAALCDAFYIGGTKNGLLFGEALVIVNDALKPDFRYVLKQRGAMLAKAHLMGVQFEALFSSGLWLELAAHANSMASLLYKKLAAIGTRFAFGCYTNLLFPIFPEETAAALERDFAFHRMGTEPDGVTVRLVTSWLTKAEECEAFAAKVAELV